MNQSQKWWWLFVNLLTEFSWLNCYQLQAAAVTKWDEWYITMAATRWNVPQSLNLITFRINNYIIFMINLILTVPTAHNNPFRTIFKALADEINCFEPLNQPLVCAISHVRQHCFTVVANNTSMSVSAKWMIIQLSVLSNRFWQRHHLSVDVLSFDFMAFVTVFMDFYWVSFELNDYGLIPNIQMNGIYFCPSSQI